MRHAEPMAATEQDQADAYQIVERWWPYDGPYSHEHTTEAAAAIAQLVRYLNNATGQQAGLSSPDTIYSVLSSMASATYRLNQLLGQLQGRLELVDTAKAYDDRRDRPAEQTIAEVAVEVFAAVDAARNLAERLQRASEHANHLGMND